MIRDLDEHTTRDDPAHDTELEAAQHKVSYKDQGANITELSIVQK